MPVWPKSFLAFGSSLLTARTSARLRRKNNALGPQQTVFESLERRLATTTFWREAGIEAGAGYEKFRARVAPRNHAALAPAISQMQRGEPDILWPGRCVFFAASAGTAGGRAKILPVTAEMLAHFRRAARDVLLYYTARIGHAGVFRGRHLLLGGSTQLTALSPTKPPRAWATELGGIMALSLSRSAEKHLYEPGAAIDQMSDGPAKFDALVARVASQDISLIAGLPTWVLQFARAVREKSAKGKRRLSHLQGMWPNFECFVHSGVPLAPFQEELRAALGPTVNFQEVYSACECVVAAQDGDASAGLRLMTDGGVFFEFLPLADFDEARIAQLGPKAVPLADVRVGVDYALLVTTPGGLARYLPGDVVRFISTEPPRLIYVGRTDLQLNAFGEHVIEKELADALLAVCHRHGWSIVNFHVAPMPTATLTGHHHGQHEWWVELKPGTVETPIGPLLAAELDVEMQRLSPGYATRRKAAGLESPTVRLVMPGVFEHWLRYRGQWGGQSKTPHCRSDRLVADELNQVTHFARD